MSFEVDKKWLEEETQAILQTQAKLVIEKLKECWFADAMAIQEAEKKFKEGVFWIGEAFRRKDERRYDVDPTGGHYVNPYTNEVCSKEKCEKLWKEIHEDRKKSDVRSK